MHSRLKSDNLDNLFRDLVFNELMFKVITKSLVFMCINQRSLSIICVQVRLNIEISMNVCAYESHVAIEI